MTFEEMFEQAKAALAKADASAIADHIAVQVNVTGDGEGIFYVEIADGKLNVEPYDYNDNDAILEVDGAELIKALKKADTAVALTPNGDAEKVAAFKAVLATLPKTARKCGTTKKAAAPKTAAKTAKAAKADATVTEAAPKKKPGRPKKTATK